MAGDRSRTRAMSSHGRMKLMRWTVCGTVGCLAVALGFNTLLFWDQPAPGFARALVSATVLPVLLAGPLFFFLTLKLRELSIANHRLSDAASVDALTGCLNRGAFTQAVEAWFAGEAAEGRVPAGALLILDADRVTSINDRFGHAEGDEALKVIAHSVRGCVRQGDLVGRLGGEEFGVFLPRASSDAASVIAARIGRAVDQSAQDLARGRYRLTVSTGCAVFAEAMPYRELFSHADRKLYEAKRSGRNRVLLETVPPLEPATAEHQVLGTA